MTIQSVEQLEALPSGTIISVRDTEERQWTKDEGGWVRDGVPRPVPSKFFEGLALDDRIKDWTSMDPEPGVVYRRARYWYLVTRVEGQDVWYLVWRDRVFRERSSTTIEVIRAWGQGTRIRPNDVPDWLQVFHANLPVLTVYEQFAVSNLALVTERGTLRAEVAASRVARPAVVQVRVRGVTPIPSEKADGHVPKGAEVTEVSATWRTDLEFEESGAGCLCGRVTHAMVAERVGTASFTFSTDCGRH
jgi:hypothetical protein